MIDVELCIELDRQREKIADDLERVHPNDLPGPEAGRHWVRFALNRQVAAIREGRHG